MTTERATGVLLILLPIAFNACFSILAQRFDYPDILRRPTSEVLARFRAGGASLLLLWWAFALTAVLLAPLAVLLASALVDANRAVVVVAATTGVLAGVLTGVALIQATNTPWWLGVAGIVVGALLMICSLEFVGAFEEDGWKLAATMIPIAYIAWSVWLVAVGVALLI